MDIPVIKHGSKYPFLVIGNVLDTGKLCFRDVLIQKIDKININNPFVGDNKNIEKAILAILKEYKKISQSKIPLKELKKAKEYVKGKMALLLESSDDLAFFCTTQEVLKKEILTPKEIYDRIDKVSINDILRVSQDIFKPEKLNLAIVGPFNEKKQFEKLLKL